MGDWRYQKAWGIRKLGFVINYSRTSDIPWIQENPNSQLPGLIHDLEKLLIGIVIGIAIGIETLSPEVFSCR
jgi:hypothetical protein